MSIPNVITARELIEIYYGTKIQTRAHQTFPTVGTSVVQLGVYANIRTAIGISNAGAATIAVSFKNTVTATTGIQLAAGQTLFMSWNSDGESVSQDLYAISGSSGNAVFVVEYVLSGL
jgi:hypothetical protein